MKLVADPVWPVVVLALIQTIDGLLCVRPIRPIARCLEDVGLPRRLWWLPPTAKFTAAAGLVLGIRVPVVGAAAAVGLVVYFLLAVGAHIRARDFGRNLFVNATGMLAICVAVLIVAFLA